jgi:hypothetical protein
MMSSPILHLSPITTIRIIDLLSCLFSEASNADIFGIRPGNSWYYLSLSTWHDGSPIRLAWEWHFDQDAGLGRDYTSQIAWRLW